MNRIDHQRLLLPYDPPLPAATGGRLPSVPQLWERACLLFARVITHIGSTADLAKRWRITRTEKKEVLGWLEPVEKLARSCLLVRAFSFLMMTPQGRKLLRETPKLAMPKAPHERPGPVAKTTIPAPGWHTIAQNHRALMQQRKLEEQRAAERAARDRYDPAGWGGGFRVVGWTFPPPEDSERCIPAPFRKARRVGIDLIEPNPWLAIDGPHARHKPEHEPDRPALILARRIEALARVIADPAPAAMRLARFLAKLPREALELLTDTSSSRSAHWLQGGEDAIAAAAHVRRAATVYLHIEPG